MGNLCAPCRLHIYTHGTLAHTLCLLDSLRTCPNCFLQDLKCLPTAADEAPATAGGDAEKPVVRKDAWAGISVI